jgi:hypothetical protein
MRLGVALSAGVGRVSLGIGAAGLAVEVGGGGVGEGGGDLDEAHEAMIEVRTTTIAARVVRGPQPNPAGRTVVPVGGGALDDPPFVPRDV